MSIAELDFPLKNASDVRALVDEIREYLSAADQTEYEGIRETWRQYVAYCFQVNRRLSECMELLDAGAWSESVRISEIEPDLIGVIQLLDFKQREEWEQFGIDFGWERLTEIVFDRAELLYNAYEQKQKLAPLFQKHILLSLSQSPLNQRLDVMRQLMKRDKYSTFWREDIESYEKVRFKELLSLAEWALEHQDYDLLEDVFDEFQNAPWIAKPVPQIIKGIEKIEMKDLIARNLPDLSMQLKDAYLGRDINSAFTARDVWLEIVRRIKEINPGWRGDPECKKLSEPCLQWLKKSERQEGEDRLFQEAVNNLFDVTNQKGVKWATLNNAVKQVERLGSPVPDDAQSAVRIAKLKIIGNISFLVAITLGGLALIGIVLLFLSNATK